MKMLRCQNCNAALAWDGHSEVVVCESCGMRYQMAPHDLRRSILENALVGGCVAPRPALEGEDRGIVEFDSWLPEGWTYKLVNNDLRRYGSIATPFVRSIFMVSSDERCLIGYTTTNAYVDGPQRSMGAYGMGGFASGFASFLGASTGGVTEQSYLDPATYIRTRPLARASQMCDEAALLHAQTFGLQIQRALQETNEPDAIAQARYQEMMSTVPPNARQSWWSDWHRKLYSALEKDGTELVMMTEVEITANGLNTQAPPQTSNGGFLAGMLNQVAQAMGQSAQQRIWQTDYELIMICPANEFSATFAECNRVRESIRRGADYEARVAYARQLMQQAAMQAQGAINNATAQMVRDNAAHARRMSAIIQDANDHATNVMYDMMASNAASHDRVANMNSEMIGGYNVYRGTDGNPVRADISYDHVYQGNVNGQDWLVGVEGDWLEPGVDFTPLDQIKGGNY